MLYSTKLVESNFRWIPYKHQTMKRIGSVKVKLHVLIGIILWTRKKSHIMKLCWLLLSSPFLLAYTKQPKKLYIIHNPWIIRKNTITVLSNARKYIEIILYTHCICKIISIHLCAFVGTNTVFNQKEKTFLGRTKVIATNILVRRKADSRKGIWRVPMHGTSVVATVY